MTFTEKLDLLLSEHKIRISDLSRNSGIPYTTIDGFYKKGCNNIKLSTLKTLADYFGVSIDYLANDEYDDDYGLNNEENDIINKYRVLDETGKTQVKSVVDSNYERVTKISELDDEDSFVMLPYYEDKAAAGTGYMLNDNGAEMIKVVRSRKTDRADFIVTVYGSSMEPEYFDGENVLVQAQPDIYEGEVGIFVVNGDGYIKKKGKNRLISINRKYKDIFVNEYDQIYCAGKVIGKLDESEIIL